MDTTTIYIIVFLVVIGLLFYFFMIRPQRKRMKDHQNLMTNLRSGDRVITTGGIYGQIESISEDSIVLRIESGTLRIAKSSIVNKV